MSEQYALVSKKANDILGYTKYQQQDKKGDCIPQRC